MPKNSIQTRKHVIEAADDLFYSEGIRMVSMDAIAERAGVTKRTLYYHFRSKDDLIAAYLAARDEPTRMRFTRWVDQTEGTFGEQIAGMFRKLAVAASSKKWKGCGFLRAAAELAGSPGHPAVAVASMHKKSLEAWLAKRIAAEGLSDPALRARQIMVLLDGASAEMLIHHEPSYAEAGALAAASLLKSGPKTS